MRGKKFLKKNIPQAIFAVNVVLNGINITEVKLKDEQKSSLI